MKGKKILYKKEYLDSFTSNDQLSKDQSHADFKKLNKKLISPVDFALDYSPNSKIAFSHRSSINSSLNKIY